MKSNRGDYNEIVLTGETWGEELWNKVGETLNTLTREGNVCIVYNDETSSDIIVIQYQHDDQHSHDCWGVANPYWLTAEEVEDLEAL